MVLFINGYGRSGSTVLEGFLGKYDGVFCVGELRNIWERYLAGYKCSCGEKIESCRFWSDIFIDVFGDNYVKEINEMVRKREDFDRIRKFNAAKNRPFEGALASYVDVYSRIYKSIKAKTGCEVIVDSSKNPTHAALMERSSEIPCKHIHLVRHPQAVVYSWGRKKLRKESSVKEYMPRHKSYKSSMLWVLMNKQSAKLREDCVRVKYEDFVENPTKVSEGILRFCGLNKDFYSKEEEVFHTVGGNPVKFETSDVIIRNDDEWLSAQKTIDKYITWVIAGRVAREIGYEMC